MQPFFIHVSLIILYITAISKRFCEGSGEVSYTFRYSVDEARLGIVLQHWEHRHEDLVFGSYSFRDSDGRIRVVTYEVNGPKGFNAIVAYRTPKGEHLRGHLQYPVNFISPVKHAVPVGYISKELLEKQKSYPNLPT